MKFWIDANDPDAVRDGERVRLAAAHLDGAVEEASWLDAADVGRIVDIYTDGDTEPATVSVDRGGLTWTST